MNEKVAYHDPCYLARVNGITDAPPPLPEALTEMPRHGCQTACCGAVSCPFCLTMMADGIAAKDDQVKVRDIAELMAEENLNQP